MEISLTSVLLIFLIPVIGMIIVYYLCPARIKKSLNTEPGKYVMIEPLRGVAAGLVVIHHSFYSYNLTYHGRWAPINTTISDLEQYAVNLVSSIGSIGVIIFFMITGFLFVDKAIKVDGKVDFKRFYIGRFFRIAPAYYFVVLFVFCVVLLSGYRNYRTAGEYISAWSSWLMLATTKPSTISDKIDNYQIVAGVLWTLLIEWKFYSLYPLICQFSKVKIAAYMMIISFLLVCLLMSVNFFDGVNGGVLISFICGGLAALSLKLSGKVKTILKSNILSVAGMVLCLYSVSIGLDVYSLWPCIGIFLLFLSIANGCSVTGILKLKPLRILGAISFSLYLSHGVFLFIFNKLLMNGNGYFVPAVLAILSAIIFSVISYHFVESKGISLGRTFSNGDVKDNSLEKVNA
jgi:Predicted acyltransferases